MLQPVGDTNLCHSPAASPAISGQLQSEPALSVEDLEDAEPPLPRCAQHDHGPLIGHCRPIVYVMAFWRLVEGLHTQSWNVVWGPEILILCRKL